MNMSQLKDEAEAFAIALESTAADVNEVVAWADNQIAFLDHPDWTLCEIALAGKKSPSEVADLLHRIPGTSDLQSVMRTLLHLMKEKLVSNPSRADQIAKKLFLMAAYDGVIDDPALKNICLWGWDALDLADQGVQETRDQVISELVKGIECALLQS